MNSLKSILGNIGTFLKKYYVGILIMIIAILVYFLIQKPKVIVAAPVSLDSLQVVKQLRDQNNRLYNQISQTVIERAQIKKLADSLANALKIKSSDIITIDRFISKTDTVFKTGFISVYRDSSDKCPEYYITEHKDAWITLRAVGGKDTSSIAMTSVDTLTRIETVHNPIIGATKRSIIIGNANPYNTISEGNSFTIREKRAFLSIGPSVGYNPFTRKIDVGISIQLPILQLKR